jgi:nitroimidazol reductase NimA-like FMN-containing flavoprotein (pyridoxamine 5'-phosphate oxidase superfamily)
MVRHPEREIKNEETVKAMLEQSPVGRMATVNQRGVPVIKPVNFLYLNGKIYIHSSKRGEKIGDIRRGSPVCFEIDEPIAYAQAKGPACKANYYYRSIIIKGKATLVRERTKKMKVLQMLMKKYQPEDGYGEIQEEILKKTAVIEINTQEITGKENLG